MDIKGKTVLVVGAGLSGVEACRYLVKQGARAILQDNKSREQLGAGLDALEQAGVRLLLGNQLPERVEWDLAVISPGVPPGIPLLMMTREAGLEVIGEIELAFRAARASFIGVTGTNGKTTVTSLLGAILEQAGIPALVGGNIGQPLVREAANFRGRFIVAELSSFQLESCVDFRPHIGVYLNLSPDHLDRHGSMEQYAAAKEKLFARQQAEDYAVLNADDAAVSRLAQSIAAQPLLFSLRQQVENGMYAQGGEIFSRRGGKTRYSFPVSGIYIKGLHNRQNAMAAALAAEAAGADADAIIAALASFRGVEHRLEWVAEINGVTYINDSKGTNPASTIQALLSCEQPIVLLLGGRNKGGDFTALFDLAKQRARCLVLYGESMPELKRLADQAGVSDYHIGEDFTSAVRLAQKLARPGDTVLLSPACASWDAFSDYQERGNLFKQLVKEQI